MGMIERLTADVTCLRGALRTLKMTTPIAKNPTRIFPAVVAGLADKFGDAPALLSDRERFTYRELAERANRYSRWALEQGVEKGDTLCLLMPNRPEFMALWLGVTRIGGVVALINTNLTGAALVHCINVVAPKHIVVAAELFDFFETARDYIDANARIWLHGDADANFARIDREVDAFSGAPLTAAEERPLTIEDRALYIYTSGTTGLPKAANINHYRMMLASHAFAGVMDTKPTDRMYDCLPMYHTAGGLVATGALLINGGSVVLRDRFSAREFWDDLVRWDCTLFQYIGELCRYLLNSPHNPKERSHRLRLACGNGLRPDVWPEFQRRFRIPKIVEFYGATEGNVTLFNFDGKEGAVGRLPWYAEHRFPIKIVEFDMDAQKPVRDERGFCVECKVNEPGEVIGKILKDAAKPGARFEGYASDAETDKKISARRVREGRRLVPYRRSDAQGRERLFLFRRPYRRYLPLEGRKRVDHRGRARHPGIRGRAGGQCLRRQRSRPRRPRRHGGHRGRRPFQSHVLSRPPGEAAAGLRSPGLFSPAPGQ